MNSVWSYFFVPHAHDSWFLLIIDSAVLLQAWLVLSCLTEATLLLLASYTITMLNIWCLLFIYPLYLDISRATPRTNVVIFGTTMGPEWAHPDSGDSKISNERLTWSELVIQIHSRDTRVPLQSPLHPKRRLDLLPTHGTKWQHSFAAGIPRSPWEVWWHLAMPQS